MNIDIVRLKNNLIDEIIINENLEIDKEMLNKTDLMDLKDVHVEGVITNSLEDFHLNLNVNGIMVIPCSLTLVPVDYPFNIKIDGIYGTLLEEMDIFSKKIVNMLDIFPIIWENILMEIPMKVVSSDSKPLTEGNGWKIITGEEEKVNHNFDKLNELLK